jgi:hypothetical protein
MGRCNRVGADERRPTWREHEEAVTKVTKHGDEENLAGAPQAIAAG